LAVEPAHNNRYLFSDHYLNYLLLEARYAAEGGQVASYNETQLEDHWLRPILEPRLQQGVKHVRTNNLGGLVRVYREYQPRYPALAGRLAQTDVLIDQVVYRLYGLTEEEIGIVEGVG
jgi:hypothetical protein